MIRFYGSVSNNEKQFLLKGSYMVGITLLLLVNMIVNMVLQVGHNLEFGSTSSLTKLVRSSINKLGKTFVIVKLIMRTIYPFKRIHLCQFLVSIYLPLSLLLGRDA